MLIKIRYWFIVYFYLLRYGAGAGQRQNRQVRQWILDLNPFINFSRLRHLLSHTTIHHSTQQRAEDRSIYLSFLNIFEYRIRYISLGRSSAQYQAVALWPGWVPPKRYCSRDTGVKTMVRGNEWSKWSKNDPLWIILGSFCSTLRY